MADKELQRKLTSGQYELYYVLQKGKQSLPATVIWHDTNIKP
jgi:hypothetical protein